MYKLTHVPLETSFHHSFSQQSFRVPSQKSNMSSAGTRALSTGGKRTLLWVGATRSDIINQNPGKNGAGVIKAIEKLEVAAENRVRAHKLTPGLLKFEEY